MSTVKIQVFEGKNNSYTEVLVDNKPAYISYLQAKYEAANILKLITLLELDNVEITNKERV